MAERLVNEWSSWLWLVVSPSYYRELIIGSLLISNEQRIPDPRNERAHFYPMNMYSYYRCELCLYSH